MYGFLEITSSILSPAEAISGTVRQQSKSCVFVSLTCKNYLIQHSDKIYPKLISSKPEFVHSKLMAVG